MENAHGTTKVCSPPSFPVRSYQGVCNTPPQLAAKNLHKRDHPSPHPQRFNSKNVGAYRIRPPHERTRQAMENAHGKTKVCSPPSFPCSLTSGRMRYAPTVFGEILTRNDTSLHRIPQRINGKYVGAYRIRPPHGRTRQAMENAHGQTKVCSPPSFPFAHIRAYAIRPNSWRRKTYTKRHQPSPHSPTNK